MNVLGLQGCHCLELANGQEWEGKREYEEALLHAGIRREQES